MELCTVWEANSWRDMGQRQDYTNFVMAVHTYFALNPGHRKVAQRQE